MDLAPEDLLRQAVLEQLYCTGMIDTVEVEARFGVSFEAHFADELERLRTLEADRLVERSDSTIRATFPLGRLLLRVVAAAFDAYLPRHADDVHQRLPLASRVG